MLKYLIETKTKGSFLKPSMEYTSQQFLQVSAYSQVHLASIFQPKEIQITSFEPPPPSSLPREQNVCRVTVRAAGSKNNSNRAWNWTVPVSRSSHRANYLVQHNACNTFKLLCFYNRFGPYTQLTTTIRLYHLALSPTVTSQ